MFGFLCVNTKPQTLQLGGTQIFYTLQEHNSKYSRFKNMNIEQNIKFKFLFYLVLEWGIYNWANPVGSG